MAAVVGVAFAFASVGSASSSSAATKKSTTLKALAATLPKTVQVGEPFTVTVRNIRKGASVAVETPQAALGWANGDAFGVARVTSSLWNPQVTRVTITEVVGGVRKRRLVTSITVAPTVFASPQTSPPVTANRVPVDPAAAVVAANSCRPQNDPIRLWPLGDSLTVGGYGDPVGFTDSYRYPLVRSLRSEGIRDVVFRGHIGAAGAASNWGAIPLSEEPGEFSHSGTGGASVAAIAAQLETSLPIARPDVIVLNIGTNGGTPEEYRQLVSRLQQLAPAAVIVMGTLSPRFPEVRAKQPFGPRADINATALALGANPDDRLYVADVFTRMLGDTNGLSAADYADDTHLSVAGGTKFARALLPEVRTAIARFRAAPCG